MTTEVFPRIVGDDDDDDGELIDELFFLEVSRWRTFPSLIEFDSFPPAGDNLAGSFSVFCGFIAIDRLVSIGFELLVKLELVTFDELLDVVIEDLFPFPRALTELAH